MSKSTVIELMRGSGDVTLAPKHYPELEGMRHNGHRWVDDSRPDRPMLVIAPMFQPQQWSDLVAPTRTPSKRPKPKAIKSRRRGGF